MKAPLRWAWGGTLALLLGSVSRAAESGGATNVLIITSDRLTYDYRQSWAVFEGRVTAEDARMRLEADKLTVILDSQGALRSAMATGNVRIRQGERQATCRKAVYQPARQEILLTGDPELRQPGAVVRGETIMFRLDTEVLTSTPGYLRLETGGARSPLR